MPKITLTEVGVIAMAIFGMLIPIAWMSVVVYVAYLLVLVLQKYLGA